ncbi:hypothetical protein PSV08DRAFT_182739 [Bipolaris maydis]|uniref:uncharacterized protein n=1 Tax=Cochliobolus heterostrophus TaxID=5016 RepID=UPI000326A228|nr:hypothetical protein J3E73DRAFT_257967 [Bipolaris maydis]KAJ6269432.1 hypothetical protein PSV08DRAFT_182739 [Bipolaris maydis]KAJ6280752.1 hypothetical protein J3E71DRAFT_179742 [Bipolaris maydis]
MDFLKRFTIQSSSPADNTPDPYADDDIYPVHVLDDTKALRSMLITCTFCFNNVLDVDKLQSSLAKLLEMGDWRKLGGRLRLKANGKLEIHVPRAFTPSRPAFSYTHDSINTSIQDHELTRKLPLSPDGSIKISPGPTDFNDLAASPSAPATIEDLLSGDVPQISVHITSFTNATFVGLTWPHTLMDIIGQAALLQAWSRLLAGRDAEVPPVLDAQEDKLTALTNKATDAAEEYALKSKQLKGLSFVKFGARLAWDILTGTKPVTKTIYLPKSVMGKLRVRAEADLFASSNNDDNDNDDTIGEKEKPFISDGDILTAFTLDCIASSLPTPRQITALYPINSRFRLPSLINAKGVFLSNMSIPGFTFLGPAMSTGSLGQIALYNRQRLLEQATEAQILAILREQLMSGDPSALYSDADALLVVFTDWTKAKNFSAIDFSPAVIRAGGDGRTGEENGSDSKRYNPPGTPVFYHASTRRPNPAARLLVNILGRDYSGGYWLTLTMSPGAWDKVEEGLKELS